MIKLDSHAQWELADSMLIRYSYCLIAYDGDPKKEDLLFIPPNIWNIKSVTDLMASSKLNKLNKFNKLK